MSAARLLAPQASAGTWLVGAVTRAARAGQKALERWSQPEPEPQTAQELLEYAFRIGRDMPGLAADLRAAALRHQASAG
jgi:hypothetical protein